ncbi:hypothetical protein C8Q72DRAFT_803218 [Fomitopsis betulina]|nr:hypothetical protein C8Q72DRAFT_803218 [Fomitopsis betulina]
MPRRSTPSGVVAPFPRTHANARNLEMLARSATLKDERRVFSMPNAAHTVNSVAPHVEGRGATPLRAVHNDCQRSASTNTHPPVKLPSLREMTRNIPATAAGINAQRPRRVQGQSTQSQAPRLSVYESPRATYTWPRFDPASTLSPTEKPVIYVTYKGAEGTPQGDERSSTCSSSETELSEPTSMYAEDHRTVCSRKRSSSIDSDASSNGRANAFFKHAKVSYGHHPHNTYDYSSRDTSEAPSEVNAPSVTTQGSRGLNASFQGLWIREGAKQAGAPMSAVQQHIARPAGPSDAPPDGKQEKPVRRPVCALKSDEEWLRYTEPVDEVQPERFRGLRCTWRVPDGESGQMIACGYVQKRHLVKRHICSKHLGIRPWKCRDCGKTFAQLSNLETHENTHTGERPHKCPFCDETFKDPARQYRHKKDVHKYVTTRERKMMSEIYKKSRRGASSSDVAGTDDELA